ncbi:MAG: hypothetical protein K2O81_04910, partial [Clostridia bacterium]|nr:hypothetical protein [Clostridia bacterium]
GKATRECTAADDFCGWTAADLEYELPELSSEDYEKSADTAQVGVPGEITYRYNKNEVNVQFTVVTPAKPHVHEGGVWTVADENKPTADKKGKATRECTAADEFCDWTAADLEYELPALNETDYVKSADNATCVKGGTVTYTYNKDDVNAVITVETPVNPEAHAALEHKDRFFMGCDYGGTEAHWECPLCNIMFDADEGGNELSSADVAIPVGHAYEIEVDAENFTAKEICLNDGCGDVLNEYGYINNSNVGTSDEPETIKVGDYYAEISDTKNMFFKLDMTNPVVYELEFNHLTSGTVAVILFVYLDGDTTATGKVASGSRGAAVQANFKDVATVSHSGNQTTSFTFDAANYAGHYLKIQMQAQKSPKFTMSVKEKKPLLKYGENKIGITEAYSMFVDEYDFVP